jgi:serine/threonine protein kinase
VSTTGPAPLRVLPEDALPDLSVPGLPARFLLEERIGRGGQARTYRAVEQASGEHVVVKVFTLDESEGWKPFDLFERECAVLRALEHPSIPLYVDHGGDEASGTFFLVMQYAGGETLQHRLDRQYRFTDAELEALVDRVLAVLDYLHGLNPPVIHRDIKPGNIIVRRDGHVWLVDFGSVREAFADGRHSTVVGTYGYMAPEQLRGVATAESDLYGLGATLAACASGVEASKLPVDGLQVSLEGAVKPGRFRSFVEALLRPDPRARPNSVAQARRLWASTSPPPTPSAPPLPVAPAHDTGLPARRTGNIEAVVMSTALALALGLWLFGGTGLLGLVGVPLMVAVALIVRDASSS